MCEAFAFVVKLVVLFGKVSLTATLVNLVKINAYVPILEDLHPAVPAFPCDRALMLHHPAHGLVSCMCNCSLAFPLPKLSSFPPCSGNDAVHLKLSFSLIPQRSRGQQEP